jgi:hypothetical protein
MFGATTQAHSKTMTMRLFIGIDPVKPIPTEQAHRISCELANDLECHIRGLRVEVAEPVILSWPAFLNESLQARLLKKRYPRHDLYLLLSNQYVDCPLASKIIEDACDDSTEEVLGLAAIGKQVGFVFNVRRNIKERHPDGTTWVQSVSRHEVTHLFHIYHSWDRKSYMYPYCNMSEGKWTSYDETMLQRKASQFLSQRNRHNRAALAGSH